MTTDAESPTPAPTPAPTPDRAPRGFIGQPLEDAVALGEDCHREAAKPEIAPQLAQREWTDADQTTLRQSVERCQSLIDKIQEKRTGKGTRTEGEQTAREALITALDPLLKGARRTYEADTAERAAYGIGQALSNQSSSELLRYATYAAGQLAPGPNGAPPKAVLKGVLPTEIAAVSALAIQYKDADWAQADAKKAATELLAELKKEVTEVLNPIRRDLQGAADQCWSHRDPVNAAQRKAFGLLADRPYVD